MRNHRFIPSGTASTATWSFAPPPLVSNPTALFTMLALLVLLCPSANAAFLNVDNVSTINSQNSTPSPSPLSCPATTSASATGEDTAAFEKNLRLDANQLRQAVNAGRVYQQRDFLSPSQVSYLLREVRDLEERGAFERSGLSNTAQKQQGFGRKDRRLCPVPWWAESLANSGESVQDQVLASGGNPVASQLQQLRQALADVLGRPTMRDASLAHECYYSTASTGSFLPRHMDERHEEMKGPKGWLLPSRRSLSWLVYLSDEGWTLDKNGGALRYFPQQKLSASSSVASQHEGNLQVAWLIEGPSGSRPVYLDSWYPVAQHLTCVLYKVYNGERVLLTKPWETESLGGAPVADFLKESAAQQLRQERKGGGSSGLFLDIDDARNFALLEDRDEWDMGMIPAGSVTEDVNPDRASLVVFDSVMVPHEVEEIIQGRRIALAGWFHEATQGFPADISTG